MKSLLKSLRFLTAAAGAVAVLAMPGAVQGFASCDCPDCRQVGPKCYEWNACPDDICRWNGPECDCGVD